MIFSRRWHAIKGETIGAGTPHAMNVIRVQLDKDGPWSSLNENEVALLLVEHNQIYGKKEDSKIKTKLPEVDQAPLRAAKKSAMDKLYGKRNKKKAKAKK